MANTIVPSIATRVVQHDMLAIVGIKFSRDGVVVDGKPTNSVNLPDVDTVPLAWPALGRASNFSAAQEEKAITVEEFAEDGTPVTHKDWIPMGLTFKFLLSEMPPEAYELMFGVAGPIDNAKSTQIAARGSNSIDGWISLSLLRGQDKTDKVSPVVAHGKLHLVTQPQAQVDYAKPEFEFIVDRGNPLNTATFVGIQTIKTVA